jgi:hypothetical protein
MVIDSNRSRTAVAVRNGRPCLHHVDILSLLSATLLGTASSH